MSVRTSDEIQEEMNRLRKKVDELRWEMRLLESECTARITTKQKEIDATESVVERLRLDFSRVLEIEQKQREAAGLNNTSSNFRDIQELLYTYKYF